MNKKNSAFIQAYLYAKSIIIKKGYSYEIDWQEQRDFNLMTEKDYIKEAIWVILSAGLSYRVVAEKYNNLLLIIDSNIPLKNIIHNRKSIQKKALRIFNNEHKINAIFSFIEFLQKVGIEKFRTELFIKGPKYLLTLPYFGQATSRHFMKNVGLDFAKGDRHLNRIAELLGFKSADSLCQHLSKYLDDKKAIIDSVIWRYATLDKNYIFNIKTYLNKNNL